MELSIKRHLETRRKEKWLAAVRCFWLYFKSLRSPFIDFNQICEDRHQIHKVGNPYSFGLPQKVDLRRLFLVLFAMSFIALAALLALRRWILIPHMFDGLESALDGIATRPL
jgi:hypothetical protein